MNKFIIKDYKQYLLAHGILYFIAILAAACVKDAMFNHIGDIFFNIYAGIYFILVFSFMPFMTIANYKYLVKTNQTKNSGKKNFCFHFFPILFSFIGLMLAIFIK